MKLNKKGLSIIEIIISIVLISTVTILMYRFLSDVTYQKDNEYFASANQETRIDILTYIPNNVKSFNRIITNASGNCTRIGDTTTCNISKTDDASGVASYQVIVDKLGESYYIDFKDAKNANNNKRWELKQVTGYKVVVDNSLDLVQTINIEIYTNNDDNKENNNNTLDDINIVLKSSVLTPEPAPTEYQLTVNGGKAYTNNTYTTEYAKAEDGSYYKVAPDAVVFLLANSASGKVFKNWTATNGSSITNPNSDNTASFVMPHREEMITAVYNDLYNLDITYGSLYNKGCSTAMTVTGTVGNTRTYTLTENLEFCIKVNGLPSGASFKNWTATNITIPNTTSATNDNLKMPAKSVTITANYDISYDLSVTNGVVCTTSACSSYQATTSSSGTTNVYSIKAGSTVYIKSSLTSPKEFDYWQVQYGTSLANTTSAQTSFTMPYKVEKIEAVAKEPKKLTIVKGVACSDSACNNKLTTVSSSSDTKVYNVNANTQVYIKSTCSDGYFSKWTRSNGSTLSSDTSSITMPSNDETITATCKIKLTMWDSKSYTNNSYNVELPLVSSSVYSRRYAVDPGDVVYIKPDNETYFGKWIPAPTTGSGIGDVNNAKTYVVIPNKEVSFSIQGKNATETPAKTVQVMVSIGTIYKDSSLTNEYPKIYDAPECKIYKIEEKATIYLSTHIDHADQVTGTGAYLRTLPLKGWVRNKGGNAVEKIGYTDNVSYKLGTINEEFSPWYYTSGMDFYLIGMNTYSSTGTLKCYVYK